MLINFKLQKASVLVWGGGGGVGRAKGVAEMGGI